MSWSESYGYNANENTLPRPVNQSANLDIPISNPSGGDYGPANSGMNQDMSSFWFWNYVLPEWQLNPEDLGLTMPNWDLGESSRP